MWQPVTQLTFYVDPTGGFSRNAAATAQDLRADGANAGETRADSTALRIVPPR